MVTMKHIREKLGLTPMEFAAAMRVAQSTISRWESGTVTPTGPAIAYAEALLAAHEVRGLVACFRDADPYEALGGWTTHIEAILNALPTVGEKK